MSERGLKTKLEATQHTIKFFETVLDASADGIVITDASLNVIVSNRAFASMIGRKPADVDETNLLHWIDRFEDDPVDRWLSLENRLNSDDTQPTIEFREVRGGATRWLSVQVSSVGLISTEEGGGSISIWRDVTEQKQAQMALQSSRERFRTMFEQAPLGIALIDSYTGHIYEVNTRFAEIAGRTMEEMTDIDWISITHPDDVQEDLDNMALLNTGKISGFNMQKRYIQPDGTEVWINMTIAPVYEKEEGPPRHLCMIEDITDGRKAADSIGQLLKLNNLILTTAGEGIYGLDLDGNTTFVNPAAADMIGWNREDLIGLNQHAVLHHTKSDGTPYPSATCPIYAACRDGKIHDVDDEVFWRKDGTSFPVEYVSTPMRDLEGGLVGAVVVFRDITLRKKAEEERLNLERQMQQAQKLESLGVLAGGIAHDFNNILMAILGNADLALQDLKPHSPSRDRIQQIETAARRAAGLSQQMLAYSGKGRFVIEPIALNEFISEMDHLLEVSISKTVVLKYSFATDLPDFNGDATQIRQVVMNLIINASEAIGSKSGVVSISTGASDCDRKYLDSFSSASLIGRDEPMAAGRYVYLEVSDNGCGMDQETIDRIFDPFFTTKFTGRGLGMAAVLGIIRSHEGAIKVYSEVGNGTSFKLLFPSNKTESNISEQKRRTRTETWHGAGTILLVDDEEAVRDVGGQMLKRFGFSVITAEDGREAVSLFRDHADEVVCVLLDLTMPHIGGKDALSKIRSIRSDVPVIICSGYNEHEVTEKFAGKSMVSFLQKPYRSSDLRASIEEMLQD